MMLEDYRYEKLHVFYRDLEELIEDNWSITEARYSGVDVDITASQTVGENGILQTIFILDSDGITYRGDKIEMKFTTETTYWQNVEYQIGLTAEDVSQAARSAKSDWQIVEVKKNDVGQIIQIITQTNGLMKLRPVPTNLNIEGASEYIVSQAQNMFAEQYELAYELKESIWQR